LLRRGVVLSGARPLPGWQRAIVVCCVI